MPVKQNSISFKNEFRDERTDFLIGATLLKQVVELDITAEWLFQATTTERIYFGTGNYFYLVDSDGDSSGTSWIALGFMVGDTIIISGTANDGTYTIDHFSPDGLVIAVTNPSAFTSEYSDSGLVTGTTEITGINFRYNIKENSASNSFNSLVDGNELRFSKGDLDYSSFTSQIALQQGVYKSNHQGSVSIRGYGRQYTATSGAHFIFDAATKTITWSLGDFIDDGLKIGNSFVIAGTSSNNGTYTIDDLADGIITTIEALTDEDTAAGTITRAAILNRFNIYHIVFITPVFDPADLTAFLSDIAPPLYFDAASATYIYGVDMLYSLQDPNKKHILNNPPYKIGNVGWYNENFNGDVNFYAMLAPTYSILGLPVSNADPSTPTDFEIIINGNAFVNNSTKFILHHYILPETSAQFKNTLTDLETNFMFDRAMQTVGASAVDGDQFGGVKQVLANIQATFINVNQIKITGTIDLSTSYQARVNALQDKRFVLCVAIQDYTLETELSDLVNLKPSGAQVYATDFSNPDVGGNDIKFFFHPQRDNADPIKIEQSNPISFAGWFVEDDILSRSQFFVDKSNGAVIDALNLIIRATHPTHGTFELERRNFSFAGAILVGGIQQMNINTTRGFALPAGNPFNLVALNRKSSLDAGTNYYYELFYAFRPRWEYFKQLVGVSSQFYDPSEDFNGFNHNWNRYFAAAGWSLEFVNDLVITENGVANTITTTRSLTALNYGDAEDWQDVEIDVLNNATNLDGGDYIDQTVVGRVEAIHTYIGGGTVPLFADIQGWIKIERYEIDGLVPIQEISTVWENNSGEVLVSILGNNLLKKEDLGGGVFKFTCLLDYTKLDLSVAQYKISSRIFVTNLVPLGPDFSPDGKQFESDEFFQFQDGEQYFFQS